MAMDSTNNRERPEPEFAKKVYATPRLVEYGSIAKLTQNAGLTVESGTGKQCL
jgi:hypothetical protein